jgi:ribosomal protein S18 acetylase RimI-like enzyme
MLAPDLFRFTLDRASMTPLAPEDFLFFDLETTGLSTAAGTVAFLAALGRFVPGSNTTHYSNTARCFRLCIDQYLLLDYPGEADFLEAVLAPFRSGEGERKTPPLVVTYNGKTFDGEILKNRCLINGIFPPEYHHVDLLHPSRRLWKRMIPSCAQAAIEKDVLGLDRGGDMPGSEAPDIWFNFLKTGMTEDLLKISDHNLKDIYGLARLFASLAEIAASPISGIEKYRCDSERLALSWWKTCRRDRSNTPFETGILLLDYAAEQGWPKAILVRAIDAEWRRKDPAKALAHVDAALALKYIQGNLADYHEPEVPGLSGGNYFSGKNFIAGKTPPPADFLEALAKRRKRLIRKQGIKTMPPIRTMVIDDYDQVYALWTGATGMGLRSLDDSREGIARFLERNPRTCFVALSEEGGICAVILAGHDGRRGYIYHTAVKEGYRGGGIGAALAESAERALKSEGITRIALVAYKNNEGGNRFWESRSYAERQDLCYRDKSLNPLNI